MLYIYIYVGIVHNEYHCSEIRFYPTRTKNIEFGSYGRMYKSVECLQ
jgi:hypothetical protein